MIGTRMNAFNDTGLGEPEQDANTALIELDKGIYYFIYINLTFNQKLFINKINYHFKFN